MQQGTIDGGVSWEPYVSDSVVAGTAKALIQSGEIWPNHPCCRRCGYQIHPIQPQTVAKVLKAHMEANLWILNAIANKDTNRTITSFF